MNSNQSNSPFLKVTSFPSETTNFLLQCTIKYPNIQMNRILDRGSGPHSYPNKREKVCATQDMLKGIF